MRKDQEWVIKKYSEALKLKVVSDIEGGKLIMSEAARGYSIPTTTISNWLDKYGTRRKKTKIVSIIMKDEKDKIRELESALSKAHLKLELYDLMFKFAEEDYGLEIKKNAETGQYELRRNPQKIKKQEK